MVNDDGLREHLVDQLRRTLDRRFEDAMRDFPAAFLNTPAPNVDYTPWGLLEHLRISQIDILDYIRNPSYVLLKHPDDYWPAADRVATLEDWNRSLATFRADRQAFLDLVADPTTDLMLPMPHTPGHSMLREISLVVGHSSYHLGEFGILRQVMQTWPPDHR